MKIDSSTPFLWLPTAVCDRFASALGLTYNETLQLYTFDRNASQHDTLTSWNLTFTISVSDLPTSSRSTFVNITLPYGAFDTQLTFPNPALNGSVATPAKNYFPLRRAANSSQYVLGRAFLQEAYLMLDYERNNFSVYQAVFSPDAVTNMSIVDINRPSDSTFTGPHSAAGSHPSKGVIIGAAVGGAALVALIVALIVIYCCRRKPDKKKATASDQSSSSPEGEEKTRRISLLSFVRRRKTRRSSTPNPLVAEIDGGDTHHPGEIAADSSVAKYELAAVSMAPVELEAEPARSSDPKALGREINATAYGNNNNYNSSDVRRQSRLAELEDTRGSPPPWAVSESLSHNEMQRLTAGGYSSLGPRHAPSPPASPAPYSPATPSMPSPGGSGGGTLTGLYSPASVIAPGFGQESGSGTRVHSPVSVTGPTFRSESRNGSGRPLLDPANVVIVPRAVGREMGLPGPAAAARGWSARPEGPENAPLGKAERERGIGSNSSEGVSEISGSGGIGTGESMQSVVSPTAVTTSSPRQARRLDRERERFGIGRAIGGGGDEDEDKDEDEARDQDRKRFSWQH
jgi:hypothetical protein